jgi:hypothetical protein
MDEAIGERLRRAYDKHPNAVFTVFTLSGHVISGRIVQCGRIIMLEAGKETAEVTEDRIEAFSLREV